MATLNLTPEEFSDIVLIYLFDQYMNPDQVDNENARDFIDRTSGRLKAQLMRYYMDSDAPARFRYKRIKGIFNGSDNKPSLIRIVPSNKEKGEEEEKEGRLKSLAKKVIKKALAKEEISDKDINMIKEWLEGEK